MRAIFLCAGIGSRMGLFSSNKHKALLPIKGKPLIEHSLSYLHSKNIKDITIVVGHCANQFEYLKEEYGVELCFSEKYKTHNNYTSLQLVLDKLKDAIVIEGDIFITHDFISYIDETKDQYFIQKIIHGEEWGVILDEKNRIIKVEQGTTEGLGLIGISYWTGNLTDVLSKGLDKCAQQEYWDNAVWRLLGDYPVYASYCGQNIALEFDKIEDILFHNAMSYEEIALWASDNNSIQKIGEDKFIIIQDQKNYMLTFSGENFTLKELVL